MKIGGALDNSEFREPDRIQAFFTDPTLQRSFRGHSGTITSSVFNPNMKQVITGSIDGSVVVWNFKPQLRPFKFTGHKGAVHDVAISPNGLLIASASNDETVRLWTNSVEGKFTTVKGHTKPVKSVDFSCDGRLLITGSDDKIIKIMNVADRKFVASLTNHFNWVRCARFSPDSRMIVSGSDDKTVKIWDVGQKKEIHTFYDHTDFVNTVRFHPDGTCIAAGSNDKKIKIWDIRSKRLVQHYDAHDKSVTSVSFHPSGNYLLSSSLDSSLKIWDLQNGQILYTLFGHEGSATSANFSNCGDFFCSGGSDKIVMVWKSNISQMHEELECYKSNEAQMKSNKRLIDEKSEKLKYQTKSQEMNGTLENLRLKNVKETKLRESQMKMSKETRTYEHFGADKNQEVDEEKSKLYSVLSKLPPELSITFEKMVSQVSVIFNTLQNFDKRLSGIEEYVNDHYAGQNYNVQYTNPDGKNFKDEKEIAYDDIEITGKLGGTAGESGRFNQYSGIQRVKEDTKDFINSRAAEDIFNEGANTFEANRYNNPLDYEDMEGNDMDDQAFVKANQNVHHYGDNDNVIQGEETELNRGPLDTENEDERYREQQHGHDDHDGEHVERNPEFDRTDGYHPGSTGNVFSQNMYEKNLEESKGNEREEMD